MSDIARRVAELSPEQRTRLLQQLAQKKNSTTHAHIPPQKREHNSFPLSFAQQRLWFLDQLEPGSIAYLMPRARRLNGPLDKHALFQSLRTLVKRHESLRTSFQLHEGQATQIIHSASEFRMPLVDLLGLLPLERKNEAHRLVKQEARHPCNLQRGPLFRSWLVRQEHEEHILLLTMHHIISDGWSNAVFDQELSTLYHAISTQQLSPLPPLPIQYADYAVWQRQWLQGERLEKQVSYWKSQLANIPSLDLPTDYPRPAVQTTHGARVTAHLSVELAHRLLALCQQEDVTLFMLLLAALQVLLARYTGQYDISVGSGIDNRSRSELERIIGFFINTLVFRCDLSGNPSFHEFLKRVRRVALGAYEHQDVPFEYLVEILQPERNQSQSPLFQVLFGVLQSTHTPHETLQEQSALSFGNLGTGESTAKFDLTFTVLSNNQGLRCEIEYNTDLFAASTMQRMLAHWANLLEGIVQAPHSPLADLPLLNKDELQLLLHDWNRSPVTLTTERCLHELIEEVAACVPDGVAVVYEDHQLTYEALDQHANQMAHFLHAQNVASEDLVGICMQRSVELVIGVLGILKAGGAYVPFDPAAPPQRITAMLEETGVTLLLTLEHLQIQSTQNIVRVLDLNTILHYEASRPLQTYNPDHLAYVICTSGSTGKPKGVMISHKNVVHSTLARFHYYNDPVMRYLLLSPTTFDSSVAGLFWTLCQGGTLVFPQEHFQNDLSQLPFLIAQNAISHTLCIPSLYAFLLTQAQPAQLDSLRTVIVAGEACPVSLLQHHQEVLPHVPFYNEYGPTEGTVWSSVYQNHNAATLAHVPIGRPIATTKVYLLDHTLHPVPLGAIGELCLGGMGLARGYLHHPELTAEKFIPHPFSDTPGERLYRTGDRARYKSDGNLEFYGRIDNQVKIRGYRIELNEIEAALNQHSAIQESAVIVHETAAGLQKLVAYVVYDAESDESERHPAQTQAHISSFQTIYDQLYAQKQAFSRQDAAINDAIWTSSYTNQPLAEVEVLESVDNTVQRILDLQPEHVLEIGCGTGLLLFRIAPYCSHYTGIDLSPVALDYLQDLLTINNPALTNVDLYQAAAHDVGTLGFAQKRFDTIILNEVVQHFPNLDYLEEVLKNLVSLLRPGGTIFIGGLRSLSMLKIFHTSVQLYQAAASLPLVQLRQRIQEHQFMEKDLIIDPAFFATIDQRIPPLGLRALQIKGGTHHNEMTGYKYDTILQVATEHTHPDPTDELWLDWQEHALDLSSLQDYLLKTQPEIIGISGIPNARLVDDISAVKLLTQAPEEIKTAGELRTAIQQQAHMASIDPQQLWALQQTLPYTVTVRWPLLKKDGTLHLILHRQKSQKKMCEIFSPEEKRNLAHRRNYANHPLKSKVLTHPDTELRHYLQQKLPEYMIPTHYSMLDALPRTIHGKVDRRALQALYITDEANNEQGITARTPIEELISDIWCSVLGQSRANVHDNFFARGGHSLLATQLISRIQATLHIELPLRSLFDTPTIAGLARCVEQALRGNQEMKQPPLLPIERTGTFPLSFVQQRLWFLDQLEPESTAYLIPKAYRLHGPIDRHALEKSLQALIARHESLRTTIQEYNGQPFQNIQQVLHTLLPLIDMSGLDQKVRRNEAYKLTSQETHRPFNLVQGPLIRAHLLYLDTEEHHFLLTMHHIISDGWSLEIAERELKTLYQAFANAEPSPLPPSTLQYVDYAVWQRNWLQDETLQTHLNYWLKQLKDISVLELPTDHPRPSVQTYRGALVSADLPFTLYEKLVAFSQHEGVTIFMTLLATFQVTLARYSGQTDISVGTPIANRTQPELENMIGFFVNTLILRCDLSGQPSFRTFLQQVRETALGAYAHQDMPFEQLVDVLQPERDLSRSPLFQVMFNLQQIPPEPENSSIDTSGEGQPRFGTLNVTHTIAKFDLTLSATVSEAGLSCSMEYNTDLFEASSINRLLERWQRLLHQVIETPDLCLFDLPQLSTAEQQMLLFEWNALRFPLPAVSNIAQLIQEQAVRTPDRLAVVIDDEALSYQSLLAQANRLADQLCMHGIGPEILVGVCLNRGLHLPTVLLAVLLAGGAYVPLDPNYPPDRLRLIIEQAQPRILLTEAAHYDLTTEVLNEQNHPKTSVLLVTLEQLYNQADSMAQATRSQHQKVALEQLAYVLFTSGSTGLPKGVAISHASVLALLAWLKQNVPQQALAGMLASTSINFDLSIFELFGPLSCGGTIILADSILHLPLLAEAGRVQLLNTVPSLLREVLRSSGGQLPAAVRIVALAGEALPNTLVQELYALPQIEQVWNLYGPTEDTTYSTWAILNREEHNTRISIGRPLPNTQLYLLDTAGQPAGIGQVGALYLGGAGLARGYLGDPAQTARRFLPDHLSGQSGGRLYFTGDQGRYRADGQVEYLGRIDSQVKVHGVRIEMGEIEEVLREFTGITECAVVVRERMPDSTHQAGNELVGYVLLAPNESADERSWPEQARSFLRKRLPEVMIPEHLIQLEKLPRTTSGKIDYRKLQALPLKENKPQEDERPEQAAGRTPEEVLLQEIWSKILRQSEVGIHDKFFALGGDSILSIQVIARARQAGLYLTPRQMFQYPTIAQLARVARIETQGQHVHGTQTMDAGPVPLTAIQHWFFAQDLPECYHFNQAMLLALPGNVQFSWLQQAIWHLLNHHDVFRLYYKQEETGWYQHLTHLTSDIPFLYLDLSALPERLQVDTIEELATTAQSSLHLSTAPLMRSLFFYRGEHSSGQLLLIIHHLIIDGVSWRILLEDIATALYQIRQGTKVHLPPGTTTFHYWAQELQRYTQSDRYKHSEALQRALTCWLAPQRSQIAPLPIDLNAANTIESSASLTVVLSVEQTNTLLYTIPAAYHAQINDSLLTALAQTLFSWTGQQSILIDLEGHGREDILPDCDLSRTVGWFTTIFPVLLNADTSTLPGETLKAIKEQLRQVPQNGIEYGMLRYLLHDPEILATLEALPQAEILFNYLGQFDPLSNELLTDAQPDNIEKHHASQSASISSGPAYSSKGVRSHLFEITAWVRQGQLHIVWEYSQHVHLPETIHQLTQALHTHLEKLIAHCQHPDAGGCTPSDFPLAALDQPRLDLLLQRLRIKGKERPGHNIEDIYPLSPLQQGLLFHSLYAPEADVYFGQFGWVIEGDLRIDAWLHAWQQVLDRHTILRTLFVWQELEQPLQVVRDHVDLPWNFYDWQELTKQEQHTHLDMIFREDLQRGIPLEIAPLLHLTLIHLKEHTYYFLLSQHHLLLDGWSQPLLFQEVQISYQAYCQNRKPALAALRPYRDYIAWLHQQSELPMEHFWRRYLQGYTTPTLLKVDRHPHSAHEKAHQSMVLLQRHLSHETTKALQRLAQRYQLTMNTIMQGIWSLLLARYSGTEDVVFGTTVAGRPAELSDVESMIGLFINTIPVRVQIVPEMLVSDWLALLQEQQAEARQYEYAPLVQIQRWSEIAADQPLFESLLLFQNYPLEPEQALQAHDARKTSSSSIKSPQHVIRSERAVEHTNYPLCLSAAVTRDCLHLDLSYDNQRFDSVTAERLLEHVVMLLNALVIQKLPRLIDLPQLTLAEQRLVLQTWNTTERAIPQEVCLYQLIEQQVERTPDAIAVLFEDAQLTYRELDRRSNMLAHTLQALKVMPETLVGVYMERSIELVIALLGTLKAGAAHVVFDPTIPSERLSWLIQDTQAFVLLTQQHLRPQTLTPATSLLCLNTDWLEIARHPDTIPPRSTLPPNLAYVLYTSGSTGLPKGVAITHANIVHSTLARCAYYEAPVGSFLLLSPLFFDSAMAGFYWTLCQGGRLVLPQEHFRYDLTSVTASIKQQSITHALCIPSLYAFMLTQTAPTELASLQAIIVAGEACPPSLTEVHREKLPEVAFYNEYGPTEGTIWCCVYKDQGQQVRQRTPIGRPISNAQIYLLDSMLQPVPIGVPGELYLGGPGLARGYLNHADKTGEKFLPHPFSKQSGSRLYRTGDRARFLSDGTIEFLERVDYQIKLRGYRIEPGEIEAVLMRHSGIENCAVILREDSVGEPYLAGYVVLSQTTHLSNEQLTNLVRASLPAYMVPSMFTLLAQLPLTANGKVDRQQLPQPTAQALALPSTTHETVQSASKSQPIEEILQAVWRDLLTLPSVDRHASFFLLGGHSLLATRLISRIRTLFHIDLPLRTLFETPTIAGLAFTIEQELQQGSQIALPPLVRAERPDELPLSFAQQRLWLLDQLTPGNTAYLISDIHHLHGTFDLRALEHSLHVLVQRHEILRTTFPTRNDHPIQYIHAALPLAIPVIDLQGLSIDTRLREAKRLSEQEMQQACDLAHGPLLRVTVLHLDIHEHTLLITMHHIISDGWSQTLFEQELTGLYQSFISAQPFSLPPLPVQYADYALWQRQWLRGPVLEQQIAYWKEQLTDVAPLELPIDYPRPSIKTFHGAYQTIELPSTLYTGFQTLSQREGVTLFMGLLAAFATLLARYTGQSDICIGTPIANRTHSELEGLIGFFVNTLVLRADLSGNPTFTDLLMRVRQMALGAYTHQDIPFEQLVESIQPERDQARSPLFQVLFSLQQIRDLDEKQPSPQNTDLALSNLEVEHSTTKFDLTFTMMHNTHSLYCSAAYNTDLFSAETIHHLLAHWQILLQELLVSPSERRLSDLALLTTMEYRQIIQDWNNTAAASYSIHYTLNELFATQAIRTPDAMALVYEDEQITFAGLEQRANQLARYLQSQQVETETRVGIYLERSIEMVISVLAILNVGGTYIPLETKAPIERLSLMLQTAQARLVITQAQLAAPLSILSLPLVCLDTQWEVLARASGTALSLPIQPENAAYILFTSGSTGTPKGVVVEHRQIVNYIQAFAERASLHAPASFAMIQPLSVDSCLSMLFPPLLMGGTLHLISQDRALDPVSLADYFDRYPIDYLKIAPSHLAALLTGETPSRILPRTRLIIGGEASQWQWVQQLNALLPAGTLYNHYGPTETTVGSLLYPVEAVGEEPKHPASALTPIGKPLANTSIYILDKYLRPVPIGVIGELHIGGSGLARGYLGRPDLTSDRFIPDPFGTVAGARLYKTGDLACYQADGDVEFIGRSDEQIKMRGYRIELGEIEAVLMQHAGIREARVQVITDGRAGHKHLVAALVMQNGQTLSTSEVQQFLQPRLPDYMIPSVFLCLDEFPLTPHGKVNRNALGTAMASAIEQQGNKEVQPRSQMEELLATVWKQVLGHAEVDIYANFFALGGHSLLAVQVIARLRSLLSLDLPLRSLFEAPTISSLAQHLQQIRLSHTGSSLPPLLPQPHPPYLPLSFAQQRLWFIDQLEPISSAYLIPRAHLLTGPLHLPALDRSLDLLIARHASLRTTFPAHQGLPYQMIAPRQTGTLPIIDLSGLPPQSHIPQARRLTQQEAQQPCDLLQGPLLRTCVLRLTPQRALLLVTLHHIIADGWSLTLFFQEWLHLYQALLTGTPPSLPPLPIQYADYALWQRAWLQGPALERRLDYWRRQMAGASPLEAPLDHPRPARLGQQGGMQRFLLSPELSQDILHRCQHEGVTIFMLLLASWYALLTRWSGQADLVVGTDSANRDALETEAIIGFFINLLPLRLQIQPSWTFSQLLKRVREVVLEATEREIPFEMLVEHLGLSRGLERMPLIQSLLVWQELPSSPQATTPQPTRQDPLSAQEEEQRAAKFELALFAWKHEQGITGTLIYKQELFAKETMTLLLARWQHILQQCVHSPEQPLKQMDYYSEAEQQHLQIQEQNKRKKIHIRKGQRFDISGKPGQRNGDNNV